LTSRRFSLWQKVTALAPVLLLLVYLPGETMLRCRMDGLLRSTCCCPDEKQDQDSGPAFKAQNCCDQEITGSERPVVEAARRSAPDVPLAVAIALPVSTASLDLATPDRPVRTWQAQGPPRNGPPLVLLKHAFLI
jgi:hypothetical protein